MPSEGFARSVSTREFVGAPLACGESSILSAAAVSVGRDLGSLGGRARKGTPFGWQPGVCCLHLSA